MNTRRVFRFLSVLFVLFVLLATLASATAAEPTAKPVDRPSLGQFCLNCDWGEPVCYVAELYWPADIYFDIGWMSKTGETSDYRITTLEASSWALMRDSASCGYGWVRPPR